MNVAILLSTYNGEKYLEEQLDSLLLQSYQDFVVYIRDDGSSDRTVNIINQYVMKDNRFINVGNSENLGCAASFINLLRNASA
ncbi:glycosyltransferase, partial [Escherichia coli]|nr:glycosyltransferase [Escherichia coli]